MLYTNARWGYFSDQNLHSGLKFLMGGGDSYTGYITHDSV
jgi:hypothetical protein